jgi:hypothetical protein
MEQPETDYFPALKPGQRMTFTKEELNGLVRKAVAATEAAWKTASDRAFDGVIERGVLAMRRALAEGEENGYRKARQEMLAEE